MCSKISKKYHILVVDDSPDNCFLIESILAGEGYKITVADSGPLAIAEITKSPPDLVLLDIMMPEMDGYEVTRRLRENNDLPFMPILLITAFDRPSVAKGLDIGADDFIRKPFDLDELLARVRSLLRLKHSLDERDHIARQREDFVSRLAHDMRTPLVAADRILHLLHQGAFGAVPPGMDEALDRIICSNKNLLKMVNELLDVYRYEAGRKNLAFFPINLPDMLSEICTELDPLAMEKQLDLKLNLPDKRDGEVKVLGDVLELRRAFTNLIGNGIKFTDTGFVEIRFHTTATPYLTVEIQDTGHGISTQDQAILFERFRTGNHTRAGSGLGLYLSRQILEAHKGTLEIQSQLGAGSLFTVRLPVYS
ncbi:MAG: hybrid sensor histidine kinase/response regulator [Hormoscilla sp. GM102CHS1]|nr:hybrid sensor histidine kinase/response regulator [Hormoscilla sp. GM102CHS1]